VALEVADNGPGVSESDLSRVFDPFFTTREGGTGLGLPIVAKILEEHGGGMELLDNPSGQGGQVLMWLPRTASTVAEPRRAVQ